MSDPDPWKRQVTAEEYDQQVRASAIYGALNDRIADLARLGSARRVLDLGCGTGATALRCLRRMPAASSLVGVDASGPMIDLARLVVTDPRARFRVVEASALDRAALGGFDRVVCNAAAQHFPSLDGVVASVARVLDADGGVFVFNVPAADVVGESTPPHPFQVTLTRAIEAIAGEPYSDSPPRIDPEGLDRSLRRRGFGAAEREQLEVTCTQGEVMRLLQVPALAESLAPQLTPDECAVAVRRARERSDPDARIAIRWVFFRAQRLPVGG